VRLEVDPALVVPDPDLSIDEGALAPWSSGRVEYWDRVLDAVAESNGFSTRTPWKKLSKKARDVILYGSGEEIYVKYKNRYGRTRSYWTTYEGVIPVVERRHVETDSESQRERLEDFMREVPCRSCGGARLRPETLAVTIDGLNISELTEPVDPRDADVHARGPLSEREQMIAERLLKEIRERLQFLVDVGLGLPNPVTGRRRRWPGGEAQRIRLATQIGSGLVGVLYIWTTLDRACISATPAADRHAGPAARPGENAHRGRARRGDDRRVGPRVDIGPGAGAAGGEIVYNRRPQGIARVRCIADGRVPIGPKGDPHAAGPAGAGLPTVEGARRARAQPQGHRSRDPARAPRVRDGGERLGQIHARAGGPAARADAEGLSLASPAGQASRLVGGSRSTR
jgi:excinuclease ABC subunit A